jgi:inositol phosphorylceramide synthase catalytic subunit
MLAFGITRAQLAAWVLPSTAMPRRAWPVLLGLAYIGLVGLLGGLRADHVLIGLLGLLDLYNEKTRSFLRHFLPFILTGVAFDSMRYFYWQGIAGRVHVAEPYLNERAWFGIGGRTPNEWLAAHPNPVLDLLCGFAYLVYVGEYLAFAFLLFFRRRFDVLDTLARAFLLVNLLGFATYFLYPAAPPWYVKAFGLGPARMHIQPFAAGANRFDQLLGTHLFDQMYGRGVDVYGAYPSLHVSYPLIAAWATFRAAELKWARPLAVGFFLLMCFAAVYLQHHYLTDVLLGVVYAGITLALLAWAQRSAMRASSVQPGASGSSESWARESARS